MGVFQQRRAQAGPRQRLRVYRQGRRGWSTGRLAPSLGWRPTSFVSASAGVFFGHNDQRSQWVEKSDGRYVFGRIDQRTISLTAPQLHGHAHPVSAAYAQPFVSAGDSEFKQLADGRARDYERRYAAIDYLGNPDFNYRSFRTTNVVRWEYRPGSTLFVVWQQGLRGPDRSRHVRFPARRLQRVRVAGSQRLLVKWACG